MGEKTGIAWTDATWNPWRGCHKVSAGCANCYMYREQKRYGKDPATVVRASDTTFNAPLKWEGEQRRIFTCSWSDFFIEEADAWRNGAWSIISASEGIFQILTKRPERIADHLPVDWEGGWPGVWIGVTAENQQMADKRIPVLLEAPAVTRFVSCEPLLAPLHLQPWLPLPDKPDFHVARGALKWGHLPKLDWVIIGCESGPKRRPMALEWAIDLVRQCKAAGTPVFVKQIEVNGKVSHDPAEWPEELRVQEFPSGNS